MQLDLKLPFQSHSQTSCDAALSISPSRAETDRWRVLKYIRLNNGACDFEMQSALLMSGDTQRPRRIELLKAGLIEDSGFRRRTGTGREAVVWTAT